MSARRYYELRRLRPHGLDSEQLGTFSTEEQARTAMESWRNDWSCGGWKFRISLISKEVVHDDVNPNCIGGEQLSAIWIDSA